MWWSVEIATSPWKAKLCRENSREAMILFTRNLFTAEIQNYLANIWSLRAAINHVLKGRGAATAELAEGTLMKATNNTPRINHRFCDDPSWIFNEKTRIIIIRYVGNGRVLCALKMIEMFTLIYPGTFILTDKFKSRYSLPHINVYKYV